MTLYLLGVAVGAQIGTLIYYVQQRIQQGQFAKVYIVSSSVTPIVTLCAIFAWLAFQV